MSMVSITNPSTGEQREVTRGTLGPWRRQGWVLSEDAPKDKPVPSYLKKKALPDVKESIVDEPEEEA